MCPTCGFERNGWLRSELPTSHPYFGYLVRCPDCINLEYMAERLRRNSQINGWLATSTFEQYRRVPGNREALAACQELATFSSRGWVTLVGGYGCGKTHLLSASVNYAVSNRMAAVYYTTADMLAKLRNETNREDGDVESMLADISKVQLLAIDEFDSDKFKASDWALEMLYRVLDDRYRSVGTHCTLIAMQDMPTVMGGKLDYVFSRMSDGRNRVVSITSGDYRHMAA